MKYKALFLTVAGFFLCSGVLAASNTEQYELQERCGKRADEVFKREYGNGTTQDKDGQTVFGYRNHYNTKLNKCFFLESSRTYPKSREKKSSASVMERLFDINENKEYGTYFKRDEDNYSFACVVENKLCRSKEEWEALIKPYMEE
jgi:hypothetical protein